MAFDPPADKETKTTCPYCGVGCGVVVAPGTDGRSADVRGDPDHPANFGRLCSKGLNLGHTLGLEERLLFPEINNERVEWDEAIRYVADGFSRTIATYGPDSVAFYVSGQILTEDYYVANKLMKGFIGSSNIDTNSRLCMASSVVGHKRAFGTDTVPGCYEDLELADLVVMVGSNFAWCHPVLFQRLLDAKEARGTKVVVIDPRRTATAEVADLHLPITPGTDVALFNWLFHKLAESPASDDTFIVNHSSGLSEAVTAAKAISDEAVAELTSLEKDDLDTLLEWITSTEKTMTIYSQGVNQSSRGSDKVSAILNTHLVTGRIGKPGMGPFSITGQPNAMGGREVGGLANQLAAHMDHQPEDLDRVARFWSAPNMTAGPGLKAIDMFDAVHDGRIKAIWIMATNPVVSMPQADKVKEALDRCPLVVVSEAVSTSDTVKFATVKLPATTWGEKTGTVTNSERRISRQRSFLHPPGGAHHDWQALCSVAKEMGFDGFDFDSPAAIYREHAALSGFENNNTRDFDISAHATLSDQSYDQLLPFQWPSTASGKRPGQGAESHRFFPDGDFYTADRRGHFVPVSFQPPEGKPTKTHPFILNTGRIRDHWHTMTRTGLAKSLSSHIGEPFLEINPKDASRLNIADADIVAVKNKNGCAMLRAKITESVSIGEVFAPMHWTSRYSSAGRICALVGKAHDRLSGQQESKCVPVSIARANTVSFLLAVCSDEPGSNILSLLDYWALARIDGGWRLEATTSAEVNKIQNVFGERDPDTELLVNGSNARFAWFDQLKVSSMVVMQTRSPVQADRAWISGALTREYRPKERFQLLAARPASGQSSGPVVCSCEGVGMKEIDAAITDGANTVLKIGRCTGAGTNCGSCKPELLARLRAVSVKTEILEFSG